MLNLNHLISLNKVEKKAFICIFLISVLSLLSLIQANVLYSDDIIRVLSGYNLWNNDGRPLSSWVSIILQLGKPLTDISPLPQILSLAFYSLSSIYLGKIFRVNNLIFLSLGGIIFVLNPLNLQGFSYIFDSFTIGLAALTSTTAFFLTSIVIEEPLSNIQKISIYSLILLFLISTLCLYQTATSIYIATFTFYSLIKLLIDRSVRKSIKTFIFSIIILFFSLLAYIPIKNFSVKNQYEYIIRKTQIPSSEDIPETFIKNLMYSVQRLQEYLGTGSLSSLILILGITTIFCFTIIILKEFNQNRNNLSSLTKLFIIISLTLFYCFSLIASFHGLGSIFISPLWSPRAFMGFSAIVGISCFFLAHIFYPFKFLRYLLISFLCLLCLSFINISLTFGNALHHQNTQEEIIATILLSDLQEEISKLQNPPKKTKISTAGKSEHSTLTYQAFRKYPILKNITRSYFDKGTHGHQRLRSLGFNYEFININDIVPKEEKFTPSSQPILSRHTYDIYFENNDTFIILFK